MTQIVHGVAWNGPDGLECLCGDGGRMAVGEFNDHLRAHWRDHHRPQLAREQYALSMGTHEPAVDDFGNQYLSPRAAA